jgi:hypothetical protein
MQINKIFNDKTIGYASNGFLKGWGKYNSDSYSYYFYYYFQSLINVDKGDKPLKTNEKIYLVSKSLIEKIIEINNLIYSDELKNIDETHYLYDYRNMNDEQFYFQFVYWLDKFNEYLNSKEINTYCNHCHIDYSNFIINEKKNRINIQYNVSIELSRRFLLNEFNDFTNNDDLYLYIPMINNTQYWRVGSQFELYYPYKYYNPLTNKSVLLTPFIALKVTDMDGDGDIKFDHIDKIDYIDALNITFTLPNKLIGVYNES